MKHQRTMSLWRDVNRLLLAVEEAVRHFQYYHQYALGADLRRQAVGICRLINRAHNGIAEEDYLRGGNETARAALGMVARPG